MTSPHCPMRPHHWAAVIIACLALGLSLAALSLAMVSM